MPEAWFESIQQVAIVGTPDVLSCIRGRFVSLEFKASEKSKRSEMQIYKGSLIGKAGGSSYFVFPENVHEVESELLKIYHASS